MKRHLYFLSILFFALSIGCKKTSTPPTHTSSKMNGVRVYIGEGHFEQGPYLPDVFLQRDVEVLDGTRILNGADTLNFKAEDPSSHLLIFYRVVNPGFRINELTFYYNKSDNSMSFFERGNTSSLSMWDTASTLAYKSNPNLHTYMVGLSGTKLLSGIRFDTSIIPPTTDSILNLPMSFTAIDDSTLTTDQNILNLPDVTLHYKSTDGAANTITFETFHYYYSLQVTTLTYNYFTGKLTFEQKYISPHKGRYVVLYQ